MKIIGSQLLLGGLLVLALILAVQLQDEPERLLSPDDVTAADLRQLFPEELIPPVLTEIPQEPGRPGAVIPPGPFALIGYGDRTDTTIFAILTVPGTPSHSIRAEASVAQLCARFRDVFPSTEPCPLVELLPVPVGNAAVARLSSGGDETQRTQVFMRSGVRVAVSILTTKAAVGYFDLMPALLEEMDQRLIALVEEKLGSAD